MKAIDNLLTPVDLDCPLFLTDKHLKDVCLGFNQNNSRARIMRTFSSEICCKQQVSLNHVC